MAQRAANYPPVTDSQGALTNPSTNDVAADTGAIGVENGGGGIYEARVIVAATAAAVFQIQHRNAANSGNADDPTFVAVPASGTASTILIFNIAQSGRVRVLAVGFTGTGYATVQVQRVG